MTTIEAPDRAAASDTATAADDAFVPLAAQVGAVAAAHAAGHDRDNTFVGPAYDAMRDSGYLRLAVPADLGGLGATARQVCHAQRELARHDGAAGLASCMHQYNVLAQGFRRRAGAADAEGVLRRVAGEGLVIAASGGSDWLWPDAVAVPEGDGFRVSGRKRFCSQSPAATVLSTCAVLGEPGPGAEVLHFAVALGAEGVRVEETWDALGMRGTSSHDVVLDGVAVPAERVVGRRPWGEFGAPLMVAATHFAPLAGATYLGIAVAARDLAVRKATGRRRDAARLVGVIESELAVAWWAVLGAADALADGPSPATLATVMVAKRQAVTGAARVVEAAMEVLGGGTYFTSSPMSRLWRDVRAGTFHPLTPEATLTYAGRLALGGDGRSE